MPASAGALLFDSAGRLPVLNPTYKRHWTIPGRPGRGGRRDPWQACRRETWEECRIEIRRTRLVCVDCRPPKSPRRAGGLRFVFHYGTVRDDQIREIALQPQEISEYRFADLDEAATLLGAPVRRRVLACARSDWCVYLEDGRPIGAVAS